jgi:hypothetical protein
LLALDQEGRLVVLKLKQTTDAGHAELQALIAPFALMWYLTL